MQDRKKSMNDLSFTSIPYHRILSEAELIYRFFVKIFVVDWIYDYHTTISDEPSLSIKEYSPCKVRIELNSILKCLEYCERIIDLADIYNLII